MINSEKIKIVWLHFMRVRPFASCVVP